MTMNNELFKRLQKAEAKANAKDIMSRPGAITQLDELEMERIAKDIAELLQQFVSGLSIIENKNG